MIICSQVVESSVRLLSLRRMVVLFAQHVNTLTLPQERNRTVGLPERRSFQHHPAPGDQNPQRGHVEHTAVSCA